MNIIGISGFARSGKDTLGDSICRILSGSGIKCKKVSFANELKQECRDFLLRTVGIDPFSEKDEEKKLIRPFLVCWGVEIRRKLDEDVWIKRLEPKLEKNCVYVIADLRFENELKWLIEKNGYSIFVDRFSNNNTLIQPANEEENKSTMPLRAKVDHSFVWDTIQDQSIIDAISYEILLKTVPEEQIKVWKQTCI